ncbi:MAG: GDSL-type esterase/lipase family protein [Bacteroidetes bacterium]|nr:GDSL-type esterase/lipase family protein [Bacteroidota bacterium]
MLTTRLLSVALCSLALVSFWAPAKKKVVFFGDSITQAGAQPGGYIRLMDSLVALDKKSSDYELIGAGIGGDKIYDLYLRMEEDVLKKQPDIVVIYVGVNDVWHKSSSGTGTDFNKFGRFYEAVVAKLQAAGIKVIICTTAVIGERTDHSNPQDGDLNFYSQWIRNFAAKKSIPLVDLRSLFMQYNLVNNPENKESGILTRDRVHLTPAGNNLVAKEMWKVIQTLP